MKDIFKGTKGVVVIVALLVLSSCASRPGKVSCPSFGSGKVAKSKSHLNFRGVFSSKKNQKPKNKRVAGSLERDEHLAGFEGTLPSHTAPFEADAGPIPLNYTASAEEGPVASAPPPYFHAAEIKANKKKDTGIKSGRKFRAVTKINTKPRSGGTKKILSEKKSTPATPQKSERKTARIIGGALLLMALASGIAIPALGTLTASIGLVAIFLLDIVASLGIYQYHKKEKPKLAKASGFLRLLYTTIFGIGIGYHIGGNVPMFHKFWESGLITFGLHLITLGILFNNKGGKKWVNVLIKSLLILAGIGYVIQNVEILVVANPASFSKLIESLFIVPMLLGEVFYALWLWIKGGKLKS